MANDVAIRCRCGEVTGTAAGVSSSNGNRVVCYCDDCQAFGYFLNETADLSGQDILDDHGGTDIFQMSPGRLRIESGAEKLACVRLSKVGMLRWFASCCRTPIGNTMSSDRLPFVGLIQSCMDHSKTPRDQSLGPIRMRVFARYARGDVSNLNAADGLALSGLWGLGRVLILGRLSGSHRPSPFFDEAGRYRAQPTVLTEAERERLRPAEG